MGGGGGGGQRELDRTPTWAVATVVLVIIIISIALEKTLHKVGHTFHKKKKHSLVEALEKIKAELMILGFISLLLTFGQSYISQICIDEDLADTMWPCESEDVEAHEDVGHHRRLLWYEHRMLEGGGENPAGCKPGKVPLVTLHGLHQLHIFIFFLAVFHVFYSAMTMMLGRLKIRGWKVWEQEIQEQVTSNDASRYRLTHETSFVRSHTNSWMQNAFIFYVVCFFRHIGYSVQRADYLTLRHGFVSVHLSPGSKFNFQKYIKRSLEDDFKVVVGIPAYLWMASVLYLLFNIKGGLLMFYLAIIPLVVILAVGTKLQSIIAKMALEITEKHAVVQGIPLVQVSDEHFWFRNPTLVLYLIHLVLFQNAFEITYFLWITYEFGMHSCFHKYFILACVRVGFGVIIQFLCSYITLPLYALVTQMGSHMKKSIFDEQTSKALMNWHNKVKKHHGGSHHGGSHHGESSHGGSSHNRKKSAGNAPDSPGHSPAASSGKSNNEMTNQKQGQPEMASIQAQVDIPMDDMKDVDLLSGP